MLPTAPFPTVQTAIINVATNAAVVPPVPSMAASNLLYQAVGATTAPQASPQQLPPATIGPQLSNNHKGEGRSAGETLSSLQPAMSFMQDIGSAKPSLISQQGVEAYRASAARSAEALSAPATRYSSI
jgi:hypothetical protein